MAEASSGLEGDGVNQRAFKPKYVITVTSHHDDAYILRRMDLYEDSEKNLMSATFEVPGISRDDIQLEVRDSLLTVSGETTSSTEHEKSAYVLRERRYGKFSRSLRLPKGVKVRFFKNLSRLLAF